MRFLYFILLVALGTCFALCIVRPKPDSGTCPELKPPAKVSANVSVGPWSVEAHYAECDLVLNYRDQVFSFYDTSDPELLGVPTHYENVRISEQSPGVYAVTFPGRPNPAVTVHAKTGTSIYCLSGECITLVGSNIKRKNDYARR